MSEQVYVQMELHGSKDEIIGFVEGMRLATDSESVWFCSRDCFELESVLDSIKDKMGLETHVVMTRQLADTVTSFMEKSTVLGSKVAWVREIESAALSFEFRCFAEDIGLSVRGVVEKFLPDDVVLEDYVVEETRDDEAEGVELYSPVHAYVLAGKGRYVGGASGIFGLAKRLADQDFINPQKIKVRLREEG